LGEVELRLYPHASISVQDTCGPWKPLRLPAIKVK